MTVYTLDNGTTSQNPSDNAMCDISSTVVCKGGKDNVEIVSWESGQSPMEDITYELKWGLGRILADKDGSWWDTPDITDIFSECFEVELTRYSGKKCGQV